MDPKSKFEEIERLSKYEGPDKVVHFRDYLREKSEMGGGMKFESGFNELDHFTEGFETGELSIVTGPTGNGKTLFSKSLMRNFMRNGYPCAFFSFEVSTSKLVESFQAMEPTKDPLFVPFELKPGNLGWLKNRVLEAKAKYDCKIFVIDHLHYIVDMVPELNQSLNIGATLRKLKQEFCIQEDVHIMLLAHQEKLQEGKEASLESSRDSSFIGQECDIGIVVQRMPDDPKIKPPSFDSGFALVKIDKARRAGTYKKRLTFQKQGDWLEAI